MIELNNCPICNCKLNYTPFSVGYTQYIYTVCNHYNTKFYNATNKFEITIYNDCSDIGYYIIVHYNLFFHSYSGIFPELEAKFTKLYFNSEPIINNNLYTSFSIKNINNMIAKYSKLETFI